MRIVTKEAKKPMQVGDKWICMCGLSTDQPFCSGAHKQVADETEQETYIYTEDGRHEVVEISVKGSCDCSGHEDGKCCGGHGEDQHCSGHCHHQ